MVDKMKEIVAYCAANIEDWDIKCGMALSYIGKRMPIPAWFRNEIAEWFSNHDAEPEEFDVEEIVLWAE